jgi:hypothetical protein
MAIEVKRYLPTKEENKNDNSLSISLAHSLDKLSFLLE